MSTAWPRSWRARTEGEAVRFTLRRAPRELAKFIAPKGSVALDGTSLTVNRSTATRFDVLLIHHSLRGHHLGRAQGRRPRQPRGRHHGPLRGAAGGGAGAGTIGYVTGASARPKGSRRPPRPPTRETAMADSGRPHLLIVEARFYDDLADALLDGAKAALDEAGATYDVVTVPGALEIPAAIAFALDGADEGGTEL